MRYTEENKPDTPAQVVLAHYGTKGMRWGVRRANPSGGQIRLARKKQAERQMKVFRAEDEGIVGKVPVRVSVKNAKKLQKEHDTHEDRVTAAHMTNGEKAAAILLGGPVGAVVISASKANVARTAKSVDKARRR